MNDGGQTASSIGNVLGGLAANLTPEAQARAQALQYQTEGYDIANQKAAEQLQGLENATNQAGGLLGQAGALPGASPLGVAAAGVAAPPAPAVPPLVGAYRHPAGTVLSTTSPLTAETQNWILQGQATPEATANSIIPLGQTMTTGPGSDYVTQTALARARGMPVTITAPQKYYIDPSKGDAPGNVLYAGDAAAEKAEEQQRASNQVDADRRAALAETAAQQINENNRLLDIYNKLVNAPGTDDTLSIVGDLGVQALHNATGLDVGLLSHRQDAMLAIQGRLNASINNALQSAAPGTPPRGLLQTIQPPDPKVLGAEQFRSALEQYQRVLQYQKDEGPIALQMRQSGYTKEASDAYMSALKAHQDAEFARQAAEQSSRAASDQPVLKPPKQEDIDLFNQMVRNGQDPRVLITRARARGVDLLAQPTQ